MKTFLLICGLFSLCASPLFANWGGDAGGSVATGAFRAMGTNQVEMQTEILNIRLYHGRAKVQVDYVLKNTGDAVDVTAGFPCLGVSPKLNNCSEIEDYKLTADGKEIPYRTQKGDVKNWKRIFDQDFLAIADMGSEESELTPRIFWLSSTVHFEKGESKSIKIQYESLYEYSGGGFSDDSDENNDYFRYLLSTARTWKGPIQQGRITINAVTIDPNSITITPGNRFKKTPDGYVWEFTDLKPTLDDDIAINMNNKYSIISNYSAEDDKDSVGGPTSWYSFQGNKYYFDFHGYTAKATSEKAGYPAKNIGDLKNETAWVAGKNGGLNESVTLTLNKPSHVSEIGIVPGYAKSKTLYFTNNRVEELEVVVNGNHVVKAALPDEYIGLGPYGYKGYDLIDLGNYAGDTRTITLTVRKVYPGSKYNDTCISEVLLRKRLKEKPLVKGAR
jgi:hypothetical protein